jgi:hypothetical protein
LSKPATSDKKNYHRKDGYKILQLNYLPRYIGFGTTYLTMGIKETKNTPRGEIPSKSLLLTPYPNPPNRLNNKKINRYCEIIHCISF